jgi:sensor histidine kinase YesM
MNWKKIYSKPLVRILVHLLFWFFYLLFSALNILRFYEDEKIWHIMYRMVFTMPVDMIAAYFTVYFLLPVFLYRKRYLAFLLLFIISAAGLILLQRTIIYYFTYPVMYNETPASPFWYMNWLASFTNVYLAAFILAVIKLVRLRFSEQKRLQELKKSQVEAELKFLKAQVHPHFLFNTLNNLYALTLDKSENASEVVLKLSDLLNYMLYECNEETILLKKEIKLIENFLSLERIRYGESLDINFNVKGETAGKKIAPMLLLPFVENAFKHGVSQISQEARVKIVLEVVGPHLNFAVKNTKPILHEKDEAGYTEGIGLKNVKRRLEILYPGNYIFNIIEKDREFSIELKLNLEKIVT